MIDAPREIAESADPSLRQFLVVKKFAPAPLQNAPGKWMVAAPDTTSQFSAVGYFFGRRLRKELGRPVGFINTTWGGTKVEAWTSVEALDKDADLRQGKEWAIAQRVAFDRYTPAYQAWQKKYGREDHAVLKPETFAAPGILTDDWKKVNLPAELSSAGLPTAGAVWIRRDIVLDPKLENHAASLFLGDARDIIQVYWNGKKIAESDVTTLDHRYNIPARSRKRAPASWPCGSSTHPRVWESRRATRAFATATTRT